MAFLAPHSIIKHILVTSVNFYHIIVMTNLLAIVLGINNMHLNVLIVTNCIFLLNHSDRST